MFEESFLAQIADAVAAKVVTQLAGQGGATKRLFTLSEAAPLSRADPESN